MGSLALVVALAEDGGIGRDGKLPWEPGMLGADMRWFRLLTQGRFMCHGGGPCVVPSVRNTVVMGRRTWDSIPQRFRPLCGRKNVVVSRSGDASVAEGATVIGSFGELGGAAADQMRPCM